MAIYRSLSSTTDLDDAMYLLSQWHIAASSQGCLWVEPRHNEIKLGGFCILIKRLRRISAASHINTIVFHFDRAHVPASLWPVYTGLATNLARELRATCRIVRTRGEHYQIGIEPSKGLIRLDGTSIVIESDTNHRMSN